MAITVVSSYIVGNSIDILLQLKNVRSGIPASTNTVSVTLNLYNPAGTTIISAGVMTTAANTPPGYWLYTYNSTTADVQGLWSSQFTATDAASNIFVSTVEPVFILAANPLITSFTPASSPVVGTGIT